MKKVLISAALCSLFLVSCEVETNHTLTSQPNGKDGKDALIGLIVPNNNNGNTPNFHIAAWTVSGRKNLNRGAIQFDDLSKIPVGAKITNAYLTLFYNPTSKYMMDPPGHIGDNALLLKRITSAWKESEITWANQPATTDVNKVIIPDSEDATKTYKIEVTALVEDILKSKSNFGFMLMSQVEEPYKFTYFASSEHPDAAIRPQLTVNYTTEKGL